ncbi:hypothetical protein V8E54_003381 [Elaphomyces granulatus]
MPKRKQGNRGRLPLSTDFFLEPEANVQDQQCAVAQGPPRSSISDDEAEVTHLLDTAELETEPEDAVSILRQVVKGLVCFDDMTLDELRGLIAFLRGRMPDRDERTGDGSRESQDLSTMSVAGGRDRDGGQVMGQERVEVERIPQQSLSWRRESSGGLRS